MLDRKSEPKKRKKSEGSPERRLPSSKKKSVRSFLNVNPETQFEIVRGLASPVRVRILRLLRRRGPLNVNQISEALGMPQSTIATNIQILEESDLSYVVRLTACAVGRSWRSGRGRVFGVDLDRFHH